MPTTAAADFQTALRLHQAGQLAEAQALYGQVLAQEPTHFDSLHLLGLSLVQSGALEDGIARIRQALAIRGDFAEAHYNLGNALLSLGRPEEALASLDTALRLNPAEPHYHLERGNVLKEMGRPAEALASFDAAASLAPRLAEAHNNAGIVLKELGRPEEALARYDRAIAARPRYAEAHGNRGNVLRELKRLEEALASHETAIALRPGYAEAHSSAGNVLKDMGRREEALLRHERAIALRPSSAEAHNNRGNVLMELGRRDEALESYDRAIGLRPAYAEAWRNRGSLLADLDRMDEALASFEKAIALKPDFGEAYNSLGFALHEMGRLAEARANMEKAIALEPENPLYRANMGYVLLIEGDFAQGFAHYESRKHKRPHVPWRIAAGSGSPGVDVAGRRLFVYSEQGLGDTIQFSRYIRPLQQLGAEVIFAPHHPLRRLMKGLDAAVEIVSERDPAPAHELALPLLSAMHAFGTTRLADVPRPASYLTPEPQVVSAWRARLARRDGELLVGICWQGSTGAVDRGRSFPLRLFHGVSRLPGVRLVSLHKGAGEAQLADLPPGMVVETLGADFDSGPDAFIDTAAVISLCDLVITSDTAVAHLAGAIGVRTWLALKRFPDWRWQLAGDDTPWYPATTLFRQRRDGDWHEVFTRIEHQLRALRAEPTHSKA